MFPKIGQLHDVRSFGRHLSALGLALPCDEQILRADQGSPLAWPLTVAGQRVGNRFCIHPMEGWDGTPDGRPSELTERRWRHFGESGAKLIWGGEAVAVVAAGRANPRQLLMDEQTQAGIAALCTQLRQVHRARYGDDNDLLVGLQLTHSGRFSHAQRPGMRTRVAYRHPLLDAKYGLTSEQTSLWTDAELDDLIGKFVAAAQRAQRAGFQFVDIKACHGYLIHELLGAHERPGRYGGDFDGRTRFLRQTLAAVRSACPGLLLGVRLSAVDCAPMECQQGVGRPMPFASLLPYRMGFGVDAQDPQQGDLRESQQLAGLLADDGVAMLNVSVGSPYYSPHLQRPAAFPPSDGYPSPVDPLVSVAVQIEAARAIKLAAPQLVVIGTGYSYLQDYLPHVAQAVVRAGWADLVGLGRMVLAYPELPDDCLRQGKLARKRLCRTFSDCTTAPRLGLISGCYPLDAFYKSQPPAAQLQAAKLRARQHRGDSD